MSDLFGNLEDRFSHGAAQIMLPMSGIFTRFTLFFCLLFTMCFIYPFRLPRSYMLRLAVPEKQWTCIIMLENGKWLIRLV